MTSSTDASRPPLPERLAAGPLVLDGAMGTRLYELGLSFQDSFDAANLDRPEWVTRIHREYLEAGAEGLHTNTFGANRFRLANHRREADLAAILEAGVELARTAAAPHHYVVGSIGPLGVELEPIGRLERAEARAAFAEVAARLDAAGVDAFALETFDHLDELLEAVRGVREVSDRPIVAYVTVAANGRTLHGARPEMCARALDRAGVEAMGLNCSTGPRTLLDALLRMAEETDRPLAARPNAGMPREVEGRVFYESHADYFARFARRFLQAGGRLLGGCCGTTPEHVRAMVRAARAMRGPAAPARPRKPNQPADGDETGRGPLTPLPLAERSAFGAALARGDRVTTVELLPPRTPDVGGLVEKAIAVREAGADVVNLPDGPRASARISNLATAVLLEQRAGIETLPHFCCRDRNLLGMQSDLMGAAALGLRNLLVVTGDPPYQGNYPDVTAVFDVDSIGLCNILDQLNHGLDLGGNEVGGQTQFVYGAALNPGALDVERELSRFRWKVEAGIQFAITQPVFDVEGFLAFLSRLPEERPPILAGIWPLRSLRNAEFLALEVPGVVVPDEVLEAMREADEAGRAAEEGLDIALRTVEVLAPHVQGFQISAPFNREEPALRILECVHALSPTSARG